MISLHRTETETETEQNDEHMGNRLTDGIVIKIELETKQQSIY